MSTPLLLIASIISLAMLYVLLPQFLGVYLRYRKPKRIACPEKHETATVGIVSHRAALTSLFDSEQRRVKNCSLWSDDRSCNMACLKSV